ncbi:hypothetical protein DASB73_035110 [Starmerella bacillaris]|uniref:Uncharacterized protein n=1 Tax=Starmerella bacillaris TaxID=1247836 RepID=A0AAV5RM58_STABA|nr:hypothetical protein DASB73_035110 [Starmerella bacillaris]
MVTVHGYCTWFFFLQSLRLSNGFPMACNDSVMAVVITPNGSQWLVMACNGPSGPNGLSWEKGKKTV